MRSPSAQLGFNVDHVTDAADARVIQAVPPGSGCPIGFGKNVVDMLSGPLKCLRLVVRDPNAAHAQLTERGVDRR